MRNQFKLLITVLSIALISKYGFSQADISGGTGHVRVAGYYCGWNAGGTAGSFDLRNDFAGQPINFLTGAIQRMTILGTNGYVGIRTASPIFPLDVRADGANNVTASGWKAGIHL